jgi:hypothetical protein
MRTSVDSSELRRKRGARFSIQRRHSENNEPVQVTRTASSSDNEP